MVRNPQKLIKESRIAEQILGLRSDKPKKDRKIERPLWNSYGPTGENKRVANIKPHPEK